MNVRFSKYQLPGVGDEKALALFKNTDIGVMHQTKQDDTI